MNAFLSGGAGYLDSVLAPMLEGAGHRVVVVDRVHPGSSLPKSITFQQADIFDVEAGWLSGMDAVVHLAACSNDKVANSDPVAAWRTNVEGSERLIRICLEAGVKRFLQASTASIYGWQPETISDEAAVPKPVGSYPNSKFAVELALEKARSATFHPFILRKPTLCGWSPRMRADMVVNSMVRSVVLEGVIRVHNPEVWRPVLHVRDAAVAYVRALEAPLDSAGVYNIHFGNYRLLDIASEVQNAMLARGHRSKIRVEHHLMPISYRLESRKIRRCLNVRPIFSIEASVHEMLTHLPDKLGWATLEKMAAAAGECMSQVVTAGCDD